MQYDLSTPWSHPSRVRGLKLLKVVKIKYNDGSHPSRVRGLKRPWNPLKARKALVAPFTGAWIETHPALYHLPQLHPSHPSRVRGLKQLEYKIMDNQLGSHPSRVRGLKHAKNGEAFDRLLVAPFTGAWIETSALYALSTYIMRRTLHGCVD